MMPLSLKRWEQAGWVEMQREALRWIKPAALRDLARTTQPDLAADRE